MQFKLYILKMKNMSYNQGQVK